LRPTPSPCSKLDKIADDPSVQQVDDDADRGRTTCQEMSDHGRRLLGVERLVAETALALDEMTDDPGAPAGGARGAEAPPPSLPPELVPQGARALLAALAEPSRECENCGKPLSGRATTACSARCRAALSRQRDAAARLARDKRLRSLLLMAQRALGDVYVRSLISKALRVLDEPCSRVKQQAGPRA